MRTAFLSHCNDAFESSIKKCYADFVMIRHPIITRGVIDGLVSRCKTEMSSHYETFIRFMDLIKNPERKGVFF